MKQKLTNIFQPKLKLMKGTRFISFSFIALSIIIAASFLFAANVYYNIDTSEIIMEEIQRVTSVIRATGGLIVGGTAGQDPAPGTSFEVASDDVLLSGADQVLRFSGGTGYYVGFKATTTLSTTTVYTWPSVYGSNNYLLRTSADGALSWADPGAMGLGSITAVGDVTTGAAFTEGTASGTTLWFHNSTHKGRLTVGTLTGDQTYTLPNASGTIALGSGTTNHVAYWNSNNVLTGEAQLATSRGGTGQNSSAWTGMVKVDSGTWGRATSTGDYVAIWDSGGNFIGGLAQLNVARGGTGAATLTQYGVLLGAGTNAIQATAAGTTNQILLGAGAANPGWGTISGLIEASTNITITATGTSQIMIATVNNPVFSTSVTSPQFLSTGALLIQSAAGSITLNPSTGIVQLATSTYIRTNEGYEIGRAGTEVLVEMIPIMGFDLPVQTATTGYVSISREIESYPFQTAATGTTRVHKFVFRYAASSTVDINFRVYENGSATGSVQTLPLGTDLTKGEAYIIETADIPTNNADWDLRVQTANVPDTVRIFQVFLAAYDKIKKCQEEITFTYKGEQVTYGIVEVDYGGGDVKCWMDRNLGATSTATAYNDSNAYGDLFQWGRLDDGHQTRTSGTTTATSSTDVPGHNNFILDSNTSPYDWRIPQNPNLWQPATNTNNPCPSDWSVPTETEWQTELDSWGYTSGDARPYAYASPLKLPVAGSRNPSTGSLSGVGAGGYYWSSTVSATNARLLHFYSTSALMTSGYRAFGFTVRCLKD